VSSRNPETGLILSILFQPMLVDPGITDRTTEVPQ